MVISPPQVHIDGKIWSMRSKDDPFMQVITDEGQNKKIKRQRLLARDGSLRQQVRAATLNAQLYYL
jgi:hypothetical protein